MFTVLERLKKDKNFLWTKHVIEKMKFYQLSPSQIKRVIKHPERTEQGIAEGAIACMQVNKSSAKKRQEIWTMYVRDKKIIIISAWRYPGKSPKRNPVPEQILEEAKQIIQKTW